MDKSIRQIIQETSDELRTQIDLLEPPAASRKLIELSALYSSLNRHCAEKDYAYRLKLKEVMDSQEKRNIAQAKIDAESTVEYKELNEVLNERKSLEDLIRSLKLFIKANQTDYQFGRNQ